MKNNLSVVLCLALGAAGLVFGQAAQNKVGVIHLQNALVSTAEGKKAVNELQTTFTEPKSKELEAMKEEIAKLQDERSKGANTMSEDRLRDLTRSIDEKTRNLNRATEDAQSELQQKQQTLFQPLGQKMMSVITKYANDNGYVLILDVSNPDYPVVHVANNIDITQDIIKLYDQQHPLAAAAPAAAPAASAAKPAAGQ